MIFTFTRTTSQLYAQYVLWFITLLYLLKSRLWSYCVPKGRTDPRRSAAGLWNIGAYKSPLQNALQIGLIYHHLRHAGCWPWIFAVLCSVQEHFHFYSSATIYGMDGWGSIPGSGKRSFSSWQCPNWLRGPTSLLSNGYRGGGVSLGLKRQGREAEYSPSSAEVKNDGATPLLPHRPSWRGA
jgi:hypothetical protein